MESCCRWLLIWYYKRYFIWFILLEVLFFRSIFFIRRYIYCFIVIIKGVVFDFLKYFSLDDKLYGYFKYGVYFLRIFFIFMVVVCECFLRNFFVLYGLSGLRWLNIILNYFSYGNWLSWVCGLYLVKEGGYIGFL